MNTPGPQDECMIVRGKLKHALDITDMDFHMMSTEQIDEHHAILVLRAERRIASSTNS